MSSRPLILVRHVAVVTLIVLASGCAVVHQFSDSTERQNAAANFRSRWLGKSEADVIRRYGSPADTAATPSGQRILTYRAAGPSRDAARPGPEAASCERQFEIDNATSIVVRAVLTGNDCRGDL